MDNFLPEVSAADLQAAQNSDDGWDYLFVITDKYLEVTSSPTAEAYLKAFNDHQHALLAYNYFFGELMNGGFIQLIQNGYGAYVFDTPFAEMIRSFGADKMADIIDQAKHIFQAKRSLWEKETSLEEFSALYENNDFEILEDEFYDIADVETVKIRDYVAEHIHKFACPV